MEERHSVEIRVRGTVQGVGFRPTVWRLACAEQLAGEVLNDGCGVLIRVTGLPQAIERLVRRLMSEAPPLSQIDDAVVRRLDGVLEFDGFRISGSVLGAAKTQVAPDAATCRDCAAEVMDLTERRFEYPFTNCTHCGPRFTILRSMPFDRARTTMADFPMCPACQAEYENPADRRFHAQAIACPACGPAIWLETLDRNGSVAAPSDGPPLKAVCELLHAGAIVAIRGLGGFHLACDATNVSAVERLRQRKQRYGKPFALMARDVSVIRRYCIVSPFEKNLLHSPEAPIVLLEARGAASLPSAVAPGAGTLGFMLPYTPLHWLILREFDRPLVMTSGNVSDEPQITGLDDARARLRGIADFLLAHNREIANRVDDSVVRLMAGKPRLVRRARGYAPVPLALPVGFETAPSLLAYGGELKATFCLVMDGAAVLSQHLGDLENLATYADYQHNLRLYSEMYGHRPGLLVADRHPGYLSTQFARQRAAEESIALEEIQHHHAHVASCLVENQVPVETRPVLGVVLDGLGYGGEGELWGGEFLLADYQDYRRLASFQPIAMPGGTQAVREPWRNTYAHLAAGPGWAQVRETYPELELVRRLSEKPLRILDRMLSSGVNSPRASSCGRLFDAVAAALGLCPDVAEFEGQGAQSLEAIVEPALRDDSERGYSFTVAVRAETDLLCLESTRMWQELLTDLAHGVSLARISARFHRGLALGICDMVTCLRAGDSSKVTFDTVVLTGGCFQNKLLLEEVARRITADGLSCLTHSLVPANDGGLALGQAAVAAARALSPTHRVRR